MLKAVKKAAEEIRKEKEVLLVHHDDADGICAVSLLIQALKCEDIDFQRFCLEKLFPEAVEKLAEFPQPKVYVDIGSGQVERIVKSGQRAIIIDHHKTRNLPGVIHVNPELFGLSGDKDASASILAFLVAREMCDVDGLSHLALIGAVELGHEGELVRLVRGVAQERGVIKGNRVVPWGISLKRASSDLTLLASVGYFQGGPEEAIDACFHGINQKRELVERFRMLRKNAFRKAFRMKVRELENIEWFHVGKLFYDFGSKVIGTFTSILSFRRKSEKYIFGFMDLRPEIPKLMKLPYPPVKVSGRVPRALRPKVESGEKPPIHELLIEACEELGGFADGHKFACSGVIRKGLEMELVKLLDEKIK